MAKAKTKAKGRTRANAKIRAKAKVKTKAKGKIIRPRILVVPETETRIGGGLTTREGEAGHLTTGVLATQILNQSAMTAFIVANWVTSNVTALN